MTRPDPTLDLRPAPARAVPEPLPENIQSAQPGGGVCYRIELAWGRVRRAWLRAVRPGYVRRMALLCRGAVTRCPHEVLDPRDLKFHGLVVDGGWRPSDDPFDWRNRVGFARWGLAELVLMVGGMCTLALILAWLWWPASLVPLALAVFVACFFRDPPRTVPAGPGIVVSPADGTVTEVLELDHDDFIGGPAVRVSIFLSIFNVHLNRTPVRCRVIRLRYHPGRFINAMDPRSAEVNENMWIGLEEEDPPHRRLVLRQVSGAIARRIVCTLRPGEVLERGQKFGMIKLGSRTELILAKEPGLAIEVQPGRKLRAGTTIVARFSLPGTDK